MTTLTADAERQLYLTNRPAWLAYVAPRMAERLRNVRDAALGGAWSSLPRDYQRAVWLVLDAGMRERVRLARLPVANTVPDCPMPESPWKPVETIPQERAA